MTFICICFSVYPPSPIPRIARCTPAPADDSVDVTSEPLEQDISVAASHITPNKRPQLEVQLGGAVTLQCPQGKSTHTQSTSDMHAHAR